MIKIHNTMTSKLEEFKPVKENEVSMYVCGPTVYNFIHIGNARPVIFFDTVRRYLEYKRYKVTFAQNFTDIDDKMINKANEEGITVKELADTYIKEFLKDTAELNVKDEVIRPKATENIKEMIKLVKTLEDKGFAYSVSGDVYFDIAKYKDYGKLSHQDIEQLNVGARIEVNQKKKSPLDFTLWKASKPGEPKWGSPWGEGRPGWHLECSVMGEKYLGDTFDIHGGGQDLIFPHHENEIAQSECATGSTFANYWMHNGMLNIKGEKMSKSKNNFFLLREILEKYQGRMIRMFMLSSHYRKPIDFSEEEMEMAKSKLERIENTIKRARVAISECKEGNTENQEGAAKLGDLLDASVQKFDTGMNEDFNTAIGVGAIFELVKETNRFIDESNVIGNKSKEILENVITKIVYLMEEVLGIKLVLEENVGSDLSKELIEVLIELRKDARTEKNWSLSDKIRDKLADLGVILKDGKDKTTWSIES